ncbi:unnamed protein product [Somion occarium]|uniref:F-box domain-containing protein n=1 Tax=Somion occarium TaxID=3059160 RepID=A0ABP1E639_9APHY
MLPKGRELPPELDEYLMNFLANDPGSLRACALTCRAWLVASREILYQDVTIENEQQFERFEETITMSPYIQECVRILRIDRSRRKYELNYSWVNNKLSPILPKQLKKLHTLELKHLEERWKSNSFDNLSLFTSVTRLSLISCGMSPTELYGLIGAFPSLQHLYLEHFIELFTDHLRSDASPPRSPLRLTRLTIFAEDLPHTKDEDFFDWVLSTETRHTLRDLKLVIGKRDIDQRACLLKAVGSNLEHLELKFVRRFGRYHEDVPDRINLGANTGLKSLILPNPVHHVVCPLLSQLASPELQRVTFRIRLYELKDIDKIDHKQVIRVLSEPNLERIQEVCFLYAGRFAYEDVYWRLKESYLELEKNGVLCVRQDCERRVAI